MRTRVGNWPFRAVFRGENGTGRSKFGAERARLNRFLGLDRNGRFVEWAIAKGNGTARSFG